MVTILELSNLTAQFLLTAEFPYLLRNPYKSCTEVCVCVGGWVGEALLLLLCDVPQFHLTEVFNSVLYRQSEMKIRLNNTKKGLTTIWSLEKFQSALEQMRELYQVLFKKKTSSRKSCV